MSGIIHPKASRQLRMHKVEFSIDDITVGPHQTVTHQIVLGKDNYKWGWLIGGIPLVGVGTEWEKGRPLFITFTTNDNESYSHAGGLSTTAISLYIIYNAWIKFYELEADNRLSDSFFSISGGATKITGCRINGSNLEIDFYNTNPTYDATVRLKGKIHVA